MLVMCQWWWCRKAVMIYSWRVSRMAFWLWMALLFRGVAQRISNYWRLVLDSLKMCIGTDQSKNDSNIIIFNMAQHMEHEIVTSRMYVLLHMFFVNIALIHLAHVLGVYKPWCWVGNGYKCWWIWPHQYATLHAIRKHVACERTAAGLFDATSLLEYFRLECLNYTIQAQFYF